MSLPRILVSKICASYPCWNREWWIFSRFPHPFNRLPKKNSVLRANNRPPKGHIKVASTSMSQKRPSESPVELLAFLVDLLLKESKAKKIWKITGNDRWSLETFCSKNYFVFPPLLKSARILCSSLCWNTSWPVQVGTCIINACVNLQKPTVEVATLHPGWISELLTAQLWSYCVKQFRFTGYLSLKRTWSVQRHTQTLLSLSIHPTRENTTNVLSWSLGLCRTDW